MTNTIQEALYTETYIVYDSQTSRSYFSSGSDIEYPIPGSVGDLQIQLNSDITDNKMNYPLTAIHCVQSQCILNCETQPSGLSILRDRVAKGFLAPIEKVDIDNDAALVFVPKTGSAEVRLVNIDLHSLYIEKARCEVELIQAVSCDGCNKKAFLLFRPMNVKHPGAIYFTSNCSFEVNFVSCAQDFKLEYKSFKEFCALFFKDSNQTIFVHNVPLFEGAIELRQPFRADNNEISYSDILKSKSFINAIIDGFEIFTAFCLSISIITVLFSCIKAKIANKTANVAIKN